MTIARTVGVDIGGTKIAAGCVDRSGLIGDLRIVATDAAAGAPATLERAIGLARSVASERFGDGSSAIGIATGGWVERATGRVVMATDLLPGWAGIPLRQMFERELGLPAVALNDVHAMGIAEARLGAGRSASICLCVAVGTGIGGAVTIDGRLFNGAHGFAGAVGHVPWGADQSMCSCGRPGCVEADAGGPGIARAFATCLGQRTELPNMAAGSITLSDVMSALSAADEDRRACAIEAIATASARLGRLLGGLANTLDPDLIVLGGGVVMALGEPFLDAVRSGVAESVLPLISAQVVPSGLGPSASVIGAGLVALDAASDTPGRDRTPG